MTGKRNMLFMAMLIFIMTPGYLLSQDVQIRSEVSLQTLPVNSQLTLTVYITGSDAGSVGEPVLDPMPDFSILRTSSSRSIEIVNLKTFVTLTWEYVLLANTSGEFDVGKVSVNAGSRSFSAPGTTVTVYGSGRQSNQLSKLGVPAPSSPQAGDESIFVISSVEKKDVYTGEQLTFTFELYSRLNTTDFEYQPPVTTGFWTVDLPVTPATTRLFNNRQYNYNVLRIALFPTESGELTIGSASISFRTGIGFFTTGPTRSLSTDPIKINVKPLPAQGKPANFSGAVGIFQISSSVEKDSVDVGDAVPITVTVNGGGNLDLISSISEPDFSAYRTYPPRVLNTVRNSGISVGGTKTWEYVIIPRQQGRMTLAPFALSFFNPADGKYHTVTTEPIVLTALNPPQTFSDGTRNTPGTITAPRDIRFLKEDKTELKSYSRNIFRFWVFPFLYFIPIAIFFASLRYKKRLDEIERNSGLRRKLNAWKHAQKKLQEASLLLRGGEEKLFCGKLHECLTTYIGDMLNVDTGAYTAGTLEKVMFDKGIPEELARNSRKMLEMCDFIRFASIQSDEAMRESMYQETSQYMNQLRELL